MPVTKDVGFSEALHEVHRRFAAAPLSYGQGTDNAWDEAVALMLGVTGLRDARSCLDARLEEDQAATIRNLAERRVKERRPLAYLLGSTPYCGEPFHVPEGVVVPRSPIGTLLVDGLRPWVESPARILDLCCGSGCLGILAAKRFPQARVVLADIDPLAISTARRNVTAHGLENRLQTLQSDLFSGLHAGVPGQMEVPADADAGPTVLPPSKGEAPCVPHAGGSVSGGRYDLILCNPPYVDASGMETLPPEFALEPALGLDGGSDGLALMNRVIGEASAFLTGQGVLIGEVGEGAGRLEACWPGVPFFWPDLPAGGTGVFLLHAGDAP